MSLTLQEAFEKQREREYKIIYKMGIPNNENVMYMLGFIERNFNNRITANVLAYNYGRMLGIRSERDMNKWNAKACFHNMKTYAKFNNGELPNTYSELCEWARNRVKTQNISNDTGN